LTRPQGPDPGSRVITTEYFTDAVGRVTEVKRDSVTVATYQYQDSTVLPAVKEIKPLSNVSSEFYVDKAGQVMKVVHLQGSTELLALHYTRDAKSRITEIKEYRAGLLKATTTYGYGSGNLTAGDIDPTSTIDPAKLYWYWLPGSAMLASDPNRLVLEQRVAAGSDDFSYKKEYWYDPGGNRLAMRHSTYNTQSQQFEVYKITRYNYSRLLSYDPFLDPGGAVPIGFNDNGDPVSFVLPTATDYGGNGLDRLYSYHSYYPAAPTARDYAVYSHKDFLGKISRKVEYSNVTGDWTKKSTEYKAVPNMMPGRSLLRMVRQQFWREDAGSADWAFSELYDYDWQGRRIAKVHCATTYTTGDWEQVCRLDSIEFAYDYDGNQVIAERRMPAVGDPDEKDRYQASYVWGPLGLVSRVSEGNTLCTDDNCHFDYLSDASGNCAGVLQKGSSSIQLTREDSFGNLIEPVFMPVPPNPSPLPVDNPDCSTNGCVDNNGPEVLAGPYQYHGGEGYVCDVADPDGGQSGRSTGFVQCGVRYYEPATGRFLQHDPMPLDPTPVAFGQSNRWAYCLNDPVNFSDSSANLIHLIGLFLIIIGLVRVGASYFTAVNMKEPLGEASFRSVFATSSSCSAQSNCQHYDWAPKNHSESCAELIV